MEGLIHAGAYFRNFTVNAINNIRRTRIQALLRLSKTVLENELKEFEELLTDTEVNF